MNVGILGLGKMGRAVSEHLSEQGIKQFLWNRSPEKSGGIPNSTIVSSISNLVKETNIILSFLSDDSALKEVYLGEGGFGSLDLSDKIIVEFATTSPKMSQELEKVILLRNGEYLECPVGGTIGPAREGKLLGLAAGSRNTFEKVSPILEMLTRRLEYLGPVGCGASMKLAINLPLMVYWGALGEALTIAVKMGISPETALDILSDSSGAIGAAKKRITPLAQMLHHGDFGTVSNTVNNAIKDMSLMIDFLEINNADTHVIRGAFSKANEASENGWGKYDATLYGIQQLRDLFKDD